MHDSREYLMHVVHHCFITQVRAVRPPLYQTTTKLKDCTGRIRYQSIRRGKC